MEAQGAPPRAESLGVAGIAGIGLLPATLRDFFSLYRLERRCFPLDAWPIIDLFAALVWPRIIRLKAVEGDRLVGFVLGDAEREVGWIATIGVDPDYRRRGIGAALLRAVEHTMDTAAYRLCVRISNEAAIRMYKRNGYKAVDTWRGYYRGGEDAIVMEKLAGQTRSTPGP